MLIFCTTCKNRTGHLRHTLPKNLEDNPKAKFVIVNYNSEDDLMDWLKDEMSQHIESGRVTVYTYRDSPKFQMAHAKNISHRLAIQQGATLLVNVDADNFAGEGFDDFIIDHYASPENAKTILWARMVKGEMTRGISGRIAVTTKAFLKVGGYNEQYNEWSADDKDFNLRLQANGYEAVELPPRFLNSIPHNNKMRFKEYPHLKFKPSNYFHIDKTTITSTVANGGKVGVGTVYRNFNPLDKIEVRPIISKVFGIGLHKTATTSLADAMETLGYHSWHWKSAHSAKKIWQEMHNQGYSRTLEHFDFLCDLPIPLLYRQLDIAYPGSKFILTLRPNMDEWIGSVEKHYSYLQNKYRISWDADPFTHIIHKALYKTTEFTPDRMINRHYEHIRGIREHFLYRPDDLLIYDPSEGWPILCKFLEKENIPTEDFPHLYATAK